MLMRLVLGSRTDLAKEGGVTTVVAALARACERQGDQVLLIKPDFDVSEQVRSDRLSFRRMRMRSMWPSGLKARAAAVFHLPRTFVSVARLLWQEQPHVVNLHYFDDVWLYFLLLRPLFGFKLVLSVHGDDVRGVKGPQHVALLRGWMAWFDRLVFSSSAFRREVLRAGEQLWAKSSVIPSGADVEVAPQPLSSRRHQIVCVAHLFPWKALDVLIDAFAALAVKHPELRLAIVGDGPERRALEQQAQARGVAGRVVFHGAISRVEALNLMARSRVLCLPSRREAFGMVLLEAMAAQTPIVAARTGGITDVVRDGVDAVLVRPDDVSELAEALRRVLEDDRLAQELVETAFARYQQNFRADAFAARYRQLFERVLSGEALAPD